MRLPLGRAVAVARGLRPLPDCPLLARRVLYCRLTPSRWGVASWLQFGSDRKKRPARRFRNARTTKLPGDRATPPRPRARAPPERRWNQLALLPCFPHRHRVPTSSYPGPGFGALGMALVLAWTGCSTPTATLRADATTYVARISSWAPVEAEASRTIKRILATGFVDDSEVLRQVDEAAPRARRHLEELLAYKPSTSEVQSIHASYIDAWKTLLVAYEHIEQGIRTADQEVLARGRRGILEWRERILEVATRLRAVTDRLDIAPLH